ncbi:MAG: phage tail protein, partial [Terriglobales bacterium]
DTSAASQYCAAYNIYCSLYLESQRSARDVLKDLFDIANTAPVYSGAQLKCIPYCEQSAVGNGAVYTAPTASGPVATLDDSIFCHPERSEGPASASAPVTVSRNRQADSVSAITIEHYDRTNAYEKTTTCEVDEASLVQFGPRPDSSGSRGGSSSRSLEELCDVNIAQNVASVLVKRAANLRNTYKFTLPATYCFLEAMDLVAITDSYLGLAALPVRLVSVTENDDLTLDCEAEQFIYGLSAPTPLEVQGATPPINPADQFSGNVNPPQFLEPPDSLASSAGYQLWMALSGPGAAAWQASNAYNYGDLVLDSNSNIQKCVVAGSSGLSAPSWATTQGSTTTDSGVTWLNCGPQAVAGPSNNWGGCTVWLSSDGVTYEDQGVVTAPAVMGSLSSSITASSVSVAIDFTPSGAEPIVPPAGQPQLALVESEVISYTGVTMTSANNYTLTGVTRGLNGTTAASHGSGAQACVLDDFIFKLPLGASWPGNTVYLKFLSFNSQGGQAQTLDEVPAYTYSFAGKFNNSGQVVASGAGLTPTHSGTTIYIEVYGYPGTPGTTAVTVTKADGATISVPAATLSADINGNALSQLTRYWVLWNPNANAFCCTKTYSSVASLAYNGYIVLGQVVTTDALAHFGSAQANVSGYSGGVGGAVQAAASTYNFSLATGTSWSIAASTHGLGLLVTATFFDSSGNQVPTASGGTPTSTAPIAYAVDSSGNVTISAYSSAAYTGFLIAGAR